MPHNLRSNTTAFRSEPDVIFATVIPPVIPQKHRRHRSGLGHQPGYRSSAHAAGSDMLKLGWSAAEDAAKVPQQMPFKARDDVEIVALGRSVSQPAAVAVKQLKPALGDRLNVPEDKLFPGFDAYQKVIASGVDIVMLATPPGFRPSITPRRSRPENTSSWKNRLTVDAPGYRQLMETNKLADKKGLKSRGRPTTSSQRAIQRSGAQGSRRIGGQTIPAAMLLERCPRVRRLSG